MIAAVSHLAAADSTVYAVTVVQPLASFYVGVEGAALPLASFEAEAREQAKSRLAELGAKHGIATDNLMLRTGKPATEIQTVAREIDADVIVIGTHGQHGLGLLLGSTANAVLYGVRRHVFVVRIGED